jgi:acetolactate synthase-1/3 small subunit
MLLIKVNATGNMREEVKRLVDIFRGHIIDVTDTTYVVELTGTGEKLDAFVDALRGAGIIEVVRSGVSGIARGERSLRA